MAQSLIDQSGYIPEGWYPGKQRKNPLLTGIGQGLTLGIWNPDNRAASKINKDIAAGRAANAEREGIADVNKRVRGEQREESAKEREMLRQDKLRAASEIIMKFRPDVTPEEAMRLAAGPEATGIAAQTARNEAAGAQGANDLEALEAERARIAQQTIGRQEADMAATDEKRTVSEGRTRHAKAFNDMGGPTRQAKRDIGRMDTEDIQALKTEADSLFDLSPESQDLKAKERAAQTAAAQAAGAQAANATTQAAATANMLANPANAAAIAEQPLNKPLYAVEPGQELTTVRGRRVRGPNQLMEDRMGMQTIPRFQYDQEGATVNPAVPAAVPSTNSFVIPRRQRPMSN